MLRHPLPHMHTHPLQLLTAGCCCCCCCVRTPVEVKEWGGFVSRLQGHHLPLLDRLGYLYRPLGP
jgi:hypothetical protein